MTAHILQERELVAASHDQTEAAPAAEIAEFRQLILEGNGPDRSAFLSAFFTLVGTHGTHVAIGLIWMAVMLAQVRIKGLTPAVAGRLGRLSVFWHFLDIIWVGVFTVVYLMGSM